MKIELYASIPRKNGDENILGEHKQRIGIRLSDGDKKIQISASYGDNGFNRCYLVGDIIEFFDLLNSDNNRKDFQGSLKIKE